MTEVLDVKNIFEIQRIRTILCEHPDLLSMFELLVIMSNERLNSYSSKEDTKKIILEENIDPDLSSDSEDDLLCEN
tara:strand:- start:895 stop:1122 length:228 start_codon:yes stop_codon:yes gene_type:complete